jgi:hypothetical protein
LGEAVIEGSLLMTVERSIEPSDFTAIPRTREMIRSLPDMIRICPEHGQEVTIRDGALLPNQGGGVPFAEANWEGCCDEVIEGVRETLDLIDRARRRYKEELATILEPGHTGEMLGIELETGDYFLGQDEIDVADRARAARHEGSLYFLRVGSHSAHRLMNPRT